MELLGDSLDLGRDRGGLGSVEDGGLRGLRSVRVECLEHRPLDGPRREVGRLAAPGERRDEEPAPHRSTIAQNFEDQIWNPEPCTSTLLFRI